MQLRHCDLPKIDEYDPAEQLVQAVDMFWAENEPARQDTHPPGVAYVPGRQGVHFVAPAIEKVPFGQTAQVEVSLVQMPKKLAGQVVHERQRDRLEPTRVSFTSVMRVGPKKPALVPTPSTT